jgi:ATP-dependent 26S proteasome regulatory subunit
MPTVGVDVAALTRRTEGFAPADLKALSREAALAAMTRGSGASVLAEDFDAALVRPGPRSTLATA